MLAANARAVPQGNMRRLLVTVLLVVSIFAMSLPWVSGTYGGTAYDVTGFNMVTGNAVPTDKFGMVPQLGATLGMLFLCLGSIVLWMHPKRDKSAFLCLVCSSISLLMFLLLLRPDAAKAKLDPIIMAFSNGSILPGYYISLVSCLLLVIANIWYVISRKELVKDIIYHRWMYVIALPVFVYAFIFFYYPIYGVLIAFKDFSPRLGILGSPFIGVKHFIDFFNSYYFERLIWNTISISLLDIAFGFSIPIIFALMLNEVRSTKFKRTVQTITYLPHFISLVVICGLVKKFTAGDGLINEILALFGVPRSGMQNYLMNPRYFRTIFTASGVWQGFGWNSILYLAALSQIDQELYEAARVDGAKRWRLMWNISLPGILPTIVVMLILRMGNIMNVGFEKVILLYSEGTYSTGDVISSFVYRRGLVNSEYSFSAAVGLFNQLISLALVIGTNRISKIVSQISLW